MDDKPSSRDALFSPMVAENCAHEHKSGRPVHSQITSDNEHPPFRVKKLPSLHGLGKCAHEHKALLQGSTAGLPGKWQTSPRAEKSSSTHGFGKCAHEHKTFPATIPFKVCAWCENWSLSCEKAPSSPRIRKCAHEHKALPAGIGSWIAWKMDDQTSSGEVLFSSRIPKLCS